jgi:hypothetical protein
VAQAVNIITQRAWERPTASSSLLTCLAEAKADLLPRDLSISATGDEGCASSIWLLGVRPADFGGSGDLDGDLGDFGAGGVLGWVIDLTDAGLPAPSPDSPIRWRVKRQFVA